MRICISYALYNERLIQGTRVERKMYKRMQRAKLEDAEEKKIRNVFREPLFSYPRKFKRPIHKNKLFYGIKKLY